MSDKTYKALRPAYINHTSLDDGDTIQLPEHAAQFHLADGTLEEVTTKKTKATSAKGA